MASELDWNIGSKVQIKSLIHFKTHNSTCATVVSFNEQSN